MLANVKEFILELNIGEVASLMGVTIATIGVIATLITIFVGGYAIYLQITLRKKTKQEFKEHFDAMLNMASKDPIILENFIEYIVKKEEFKNRFLDLIRTEMENILDSRRVLEKQECESLKEEQNVQNQFQGKE